MSEPNETASETPAPNIPGYRIDGMLGKGATGVVYLARQLSIDREVALKVLHPELVRNMRSVKRLQREARTAARLAHPNLISAIDMGQTEGTWWFAMELVHGKSLAQLLDLDGRLKEERALPVFIRLCDALHHACERGVVHRDIKPANILLERGDNPRLVDLGLARVEEDPMITRTGATLGTPHYMSPEQARDPVLADVRSDIWSLGATMFHTVCGQPPFNGVSAAEILSGVLYGTIPDPLELRPNLSRGMALVLRKCLSRNPDKRYFNPAELSEDLERVRDRKAPAIKPSALEPLDPGAATGRRRGLLGAATLGGIVVAGALLLVWHPWNRLAEENPGGNAPAAQTPWLPLAQLIEDVKLGEVPIGPAFGELSTLEARAPKWAGSELGQARALLHQRLEQELHRFWPIAEGRLRALIDERQFAAAGVYLETGLKQDLEKELGFASSLPRERDRAQFKSKCQYFGRALEDAERRAFEAAVTSVEDWGESIFMPRIDRLQKQGEWDEARALLARDFSDLYAEAPCDLSGLDPLEIDASLTELRGRLQKRLLDLERDWTRLDFSTLRPAVGLLADQAEDRVRSRLELHNTTELAEEFDELLTRHKLTRDELERAETHRSLDYFYERQRDLFDLEDRLLEEDARQLLERLDSESEPFYRRRAYEEAEAFWRSKIEEEVLRDAREIVGVRIDEARELLALLHRAAEGVEKLKGEEVRLPQGGLFVRGTVESKGDPLEDGIRLILSSNSRPRYYLREQPGKICEVLDFRSVELFAKGGPDVEPDAELRLQLALFRYREGDFDGTQELRDSGTFTGIHLIESDLFSRLDEKLHDAGELQSRRRKAAIAECRLALDETLGREDPDGQANLISRLLLEYGAPGDALTLDEVRLLRSRRRILEADVPPSTPEEFVSVFGTSEVEFPGFDLVRLRFTFDGTEVGAWDRGEWYFDGDSSWCSVEVGDLHELVEQPAPTLPLVDPFLFDKGPVDITLRMFQPADSPPELFMISALGFHVAIVGPEEGRGGRVLADNIGPFDVADRAAHGEGDEFEGLRKDAEHTIQLRLIRTSGKIDVIVDGQPVHSVLRTPPRDRQESSELSFRALEPVWVLEVTLEGKRR